jgi:Transposase DDE domain
VSHRRLARAEWTLLVTNAPAALVSAPEALLRMRARWQVDRLFTLCKRHGLLDESRSTKAWHRLCALYAKLLALLLQHWLLLRRCWRSPDRSLLPAAQTVQRFATALALALPHPKRLAAVIGKLHACLRVGCRFTQRKTTPATYQLLLASNKCP